MVVGDLEGQPGRSADDPFARVVRCNDPLCVAQPKQPCCRLWLVAMTNAATVGALPIGKLDAAGKGDAQDVTAWLNEGGGVDAHCAERYGFTLLMAAALGGQKTMLRMLLRRGASINLQDSNGFTALMGAAVRGHTTIAQALLDAKADVSLQDTYRTLQDTSGRTALTWAEQRKHTATAQLLRQHTRQQARGRPFDLHRVRGTLSGRRVSIAGLKGRPELNGRCGVAGRFDAAKGRYEVAVEGEAEAVLMKPANLQDISKLTLTLTLTPNPYP